MPAGHSSFFVLKSCLHSLLHIAVKIVVFNSLKLSKLKQFIHNGSLIIFIMSTLGMVNVDLFFHAPASSFLCSTCYVLDHMHSHSADSQVVLPLEYQYLELWPHHYFGEYWFFLHLSI